MLENVGLGEYLGVQVDPLTCPTNYECHDNLHVNHFSNIVCQSVLCIYICVRDVFTTFLEFVTNPFYQLS